MKQQRKREQKSHDDKGRLLNIVERAQMQPELQMAFFEEFSNPALVAMVQLKVIEQDVFQGRAIITPDGLADYANKARGLGDNALAERIVRKQVSAALKMYDYGLALIAASQLPSNEKVIRHISNCRLYDIMSNLNPPIPENRTQLFSSYISRVEEACHQMPEGIVRRIALRAYKTLMKSQFSDAHEGCYLAGLLAEEFLPAQYVIKAGEGVIEHLKSHDTEIDDDLADMVNAVLGLPIEKVKPYMGMIIGAILANDCEKALGYIEKYGLKVDGECLNTAYNISLAYGDFHNALMLRRNFEQIKDPDARIEDLEKLAGMAYAVEGRIR